MIYRAQRLRGPVVDGNFFLYWLTDGLTQGRKWPWRNIYVHTQRERREALLLTPGPKKMMINHLQQQPLAQFRGLYQIFSLTLSLPTCIIILPHPVLSWLPPVLVLNAVLRRESHTGHGQAGFQLIDNDERLGRKSIGKVSQESGLGCMAEREKTKESLSYPREEVYRYAIRPTFIPASAGR